MQKHYQITIPGLSITGDFPAARRRLNADFPRVLEVLATTIPAIVLVAYHGEDEIDAGLQALSDSVATRRMSVRSVMEALNKRARKERAYTTYMTIMARLHKKGVLVRQREGKPDY